MYAFWVLETDSVIDDDCWKQVWAEMTESELEDRLFAYICLSIQTPNAHVGRVVQLIQEVEWCGQVGIVERACEGRDDASCEGRGMRARSLHGPRQHAYPDPVEGWRA
jgi:hypothetical protein